MPVAPGRHDPDMAIIAISGAEYWFPETEVRKAGADAYLSKHRAGEDIVAALAKALELHCQPERPVSNNIRGHVSLGSETVQLSEREREILKLLAEGFSLDEAAAFLYISSATVRKHREHLFDKLGTSNTAKLTLIAVHMGLVQST